MRKFTSGFTFIFILLLVMSSQLKAQDDYKFEIGGGAGLNFYMGDANQTKLYNRVGPTLSGIFRYNMNLRWSVKANLVLGHISGDTNSSKNVFPFQQQTSFSRMFYEAGGQIEMNFFNYSDQFEYLGTKRYTPYVLLGFGVTYGSGEKSYLGLNMPIGIGFKYKLTPRLNLGFEFSMRKLFNDTFDVTKKDGFNLDDPYHLGHNFFKNNDWYSLTMFTVTWSFGARPCPCQNIE